MSAVVLLAPKAGTKGATRAVLAERSRREPNTLLIVQTTGLVARGGTIERLGPTLFRLVVALAGSPGQFLAHSAIEAALWGDRADGGPVSGKTSLAVLLNKGDDRLDALGIAIETNPMLGRQLVFKPLIGRFAPTKLHVVEGTRSGAHWLPQARAMRERGASFAAIGEAVGRAASTVSRALQGRRSLTSGKRTRSPQAAQRGRDRNEARREAKRTGEPVEQIYARWGCETVSRSRLWDQRRAAAQQSEASP